MGLSGLLRILPEKWRVSEKHRGSKFSYCRPVALPVFSHRALVNAYQSQPTLGVQKVGISLFFTVVDYVSDETQRHPPTRQFFTSCVEILGQVRLSCVFSLIYVWWVPAVSSLDIIRVDSTLKGSESYLS